MEACCGQASDAGKTRESKTANPRFAQLVARALVPAAPRLIGVRLVSCEE
jgi:hypothetical protein